MSEFLKQLKELNDLFDGGAEIAMDAEDNQIIVKGRDYVRERNGEIVEPGAIGGVLENQSVTIERIYAADLEYADDYDASKGFKDTLTPLIATIKEDNERMYVGMESTDESRQMFGLEIYCNPHPAKREALEARLEEIVTDAIETHRDELLACMGVPVKEGMHVNKLHRVASLIENDVQSTVAQSETAT